MENNKEQWANSVLQDQKVDRTVLYIYIFKLQISGDSVVYINTSRSRTGQPRPCSSSRAKRKSKPSLRNNNNILFRPMLINHKQHSLSLQNNTHNTCLKELG